MAHSDCIGIVSYYDHSDHTYSDQAVQDKKAATKQQIKMPRKGRFRYILFFVNS
jgi:hypothetical protein